MKTDRKISNTFPKYLFWDVDSSKLKVDDDKFFIIPRSLYFTTEDTFNEDISRLEEVYSKNEIVKCVNKTHQSIPDAISKLLEKKYSLAF